MRADDSRRGAAPALKKAGPGPLYKMDAKTYDHLMDGRPSSESE